MRREYWRKAWCPDKCPQCGVGFPKLKGNSFGDLLKFCHSGWHLTLDKHPKWGGPCWFGECKDCQIIESMKSPCWMAMLPTPPGPRPLVFSFSIGD